MRWVAYGLAVVVGCGFAPAPLTTSGPDGPPGDQDGDGVRDDLDNCPTMPNTDQSDHDGDGYGDVCDKCPHIHDPVDPDMDGDGVGDACDPRPSTPGDHRIFFEGFYDTNAVNGWTRVGPLTWVISLGAVHQDSAAAGDYLLIAPPTYQHLYAATSFTITATSANGAIGFCTGAKPANAQYYCCTVSTNGANVSVRASSTVDVAQQKTWTGTFAVGDKIDLIQDLATSNSCEAKQGVTDVKVSGNIGATDGNFELYTGGEGAAFDYVFLVEIGS